MRPFVPVSLVCSVLAGVGLALASPATDLFQAATRTLTANYYGWSDADRPALIAQYAATLDADCAPVAESCSYDQGRAVLKDMLAQLHDAHTSVRDAEGAERLREVQDDLTVPRTGLRVVKTPLGLLVVGVSPGSPAELADLRRFDLLVAVGDLAVTEGRADPAAFVRLERQAAPITVSVQRAGQSPRAVTLTPAPLKARDVPILSWQQTPAGRVAIIQYPTFLPGDSAELFLKTLRQAQGAGAAGLVVDVRYNGGGRLDQCVQAASAFEPTFYQARTLGSQGRLNTWDYAAIGGEGSAPGRVRELLSASRALPAPLWTGPTAILMDENTASCAEVFGYFARQAGVVLVGQPTKGVMNSGVSFFPLPDQGVLSVTMLRAYDLSGHPLPGRLEPDVNVPADLAALTGQGQDTALQAALGAVQSRLSGAASVETPGR